VHAGHLANPFGGVSTPVYQSATFRFRSLAAMLEAFHEGPGAMVYSRYSNPTVAACEQKLANIEGAEAALAFSSGMAAITSTLFMLLGAGDRIACQREIYGGTFEFLSHWADRLGWTVDWFSIRELDSLDVMLESRPKVVYAESPTNPTLRLVDLRRLAERARAVDAALVIDNTFATGLLQRPLELGADVVVQSATKYLSGHSDLVAGAAMGSRERMVALWKVRKLLGGCMDPSAAWLLERSLKTMPLRVERACQNAHEVAAFLAKHPLVERVHYPGLTSHPEHALAKSQMKYFGAMVTIELAGDLQTAARFVDSLRVFQLAASLGSIESLVSVPAASSHFALTPEERAEAGVTEGMVRLSVGIEDARDLIDDLAQALVHVSAGAVPARA
jgi:cystathionine beta-lyase/cystathionine gamma-synthase